MARDRKDTESAHGASAPALAVLVRNLGGGEAAEKLAALIRHRADELPLPGSGRTLERWRALAEVASHDLSLAKLYEGHTDALAIMAELQAPHPAAALRWAVWCADPPGMRVDVASTTSHSTTGPGSTVRLFGHKPWCSGALGVDQALVSGWLANGQRCLVAVAMGQPSIRTTATHWNAVGMAASASVDVHFDGAAGVLIGAPGEYLSRPGFIHGGAGVAACWYGAATRIAFYLRDAVVAQGEDAHRQAHLGAIDVALSSAASLLREAATQIDRTPSETGLLAVSRARLAVEAAAEEVLRRVPRAIGPGPLCKDRSLALLMADLPIFMRQSHAERDQAALGRHIADVNGESPWML